MTAMEKMQNFVLAGRQIRVGLVTEKVQQMVQRDGGGGAYRSSDLDDPDKGQFLVHVLNSVLFTF